MSSTPEPRTSQALFAQGSAINSKAHVAVSSPAHDQHAASFSDLEASTSTSASSSFSSPYSETRSSPYQRRLLFPTRSFSIRLFKTGRGCIPRIFLLSALFLTLLTIGALNIARVFERRAQLIISEADTRQGPLPGANQSDGNKEGEGTQDSVETLRIGENEYPPSVLGPPTAHFRDNTPNTTLYVTGWLAAGWTNDFLTYMHLLYLAFLSGRTAVLPPFSPSNVGFESGYVPVSSVFDLQRLAKALGRAPFLDRDDEESRASTHGNNAFPIIEWQDLKSHISNFSADSPPASDRLGCWSLWATGSAESERPPKPRQNAMEEHLGLDVSYTAVPKESKLTPYYNDPHIRMESLMALLFADGRKDAGLPSEATFGSKGVKGGEGHKMLPDEKMACFDFAYYVASVRTFEFGFDFSAAWRFVGTHLHWIPALDQLADLLLRETFSLPTVEGEEHRSDIPPFITVHVRHGDFGNWCTKPSNAGDENGNEDDDEDENEEGPFPDCFAPLSAYAVRVAEVRAELQARHGVDVARVLVTSDEDSPAWWARVRAMGWGRVDHEALRTEARFGRWYPVFVDAVIQARGAGFVGTDVSTMSIIAARRVRDWNGGPTRLVKWGTPGADTHRRRRHVTLGIGYEFEFVI